MSYYSITGSGDRWFWCFWESDPTGKPDRSGYAGSQKDARCDAFHYPFTPEQLPANYAKAWRGLTNLCKSCGSANLTIGSGKGQHYASLRCFDCGTFQKWLSYEQSQKLESHMPCPGKKKGQSPLNDEGDTTHA